MSNKAWKNSERKMAEALGGQRIPVTGRIRGSAPDIEHDTFAIEHKYGQKILSSRLKTALDQAEASADTLEKNEKKRIPLVTFEETTPPGYPNLRGIFMTLENFLELLADPPVSNELRWLKNYNPTTR